MIMTLQRWKLGKSIGVGGFGEIYLCTEIAANSNCRAASASFDDSAPLAVKIEPVRVKTFCTRHAQTLIKVPFENVPLPQIRSTRTDLSSSR